MSAYHVQKFIWELDRNRSLKETFKANPDSVLSNYPLTDEERRILKDSGRVGIARDGSPPDFDQTVHARFWDRA